MAGAATHQCLTRRKSEDQESVWFARVNFYNIRAFLPCAIAILPVQNKEGRHCTGRAPIQLLGTKGLLLLNIRIERFLECK